MGGLLRGKGRKIHLNPSPGTKPVTEPVTQTAGRDAHDLDERPGP